MIHEPVPQPSLWPHRALVTLSVLLSFACGMLAEASVQYLRKLRAAELGLREIPARPARAPWFSGDCNEVYRTCKQRERMEQTKKGKKA